MNTLVLNEHRCKCGKLLLKGIFFNGVAEIKCKSCGAINKIGNIKFENDNSHYLFIINEKGAIANASESACKTLGYSQKELIGKICKEIDPSVTKEIKEKIFGKDSVLNEDNYFQLDTFHLAKNGQLIPVVANLKLYNPDQKEKSVLVSVNIKNLTTEKNSSTVNNARFTQESCDFYFEIDKKGIATYISPSMEKIFSISQQESIGKNYLDFLPTKESKEAKQDLEYFSKKHLSYRKVRNEGITINNKKFIYEVYFVASFNDTGKFIGYKVCGWIKKK